MHLDGEDLLIKNHFSIFVLAFLLVGMVAFVKPVQKVEAASPTVYIRADGLVDPPTSNITNVGNVTYTLTEDIVTAGSAIIVQRDNIIVDGAGHTVQTGGWNGIELVNRNNVTAKNLNITGCYHGIFIDASTWITVDNCTFTGNSDAIDIGYSGASNCTITRNNVTGQSNGITLRTIYDALISGNIVLQNGYGLILHGGTNVTIQNNLISGNTWGIWPLSGGSNITIVDNTISDNYCGVSFQGGNDSTRIIYHNRFVNNTIHAQSLIGAVYRWDYGYPAGGNYWSGYVCPDLFNGPHQNITGGDGIGDTPYIIDANNRDNYPFMLVSICNVSQTPPKDNVLSTNDVSVNATVTHLNPLEQVILNCTYTNSSGTWTTTINMTNLIDDIWNGIIPPFPIGTNMTYTIIAQDNAGNSISSKNQGYIFGYPVVIPEFPTIALLPILFAATLFAALVLRRKHMT
jgi:parallel beta-helix repeat protein